MSSMNDEEFAYLIDCAMERQNNRHGTNRHTDDIKAHPEKWFLGLFDIKDDMLSICRYLEDCRFPHGEFFQRIAISEEHKDDIEYIQKLHCPA